MPNYPGKRLLDMIAAAVACAAFTPVALGIAVAIWLEDGGPPFYRQRRVGRQRRPFTVLKLRSMRGAEVTRMGRWLRRTGLDELPQFMNVWRGDMSVVGPRPLTEPDIKRLRWDDARARLALRGQTGHHRSIAAAGGSRRPCQPPFRPLVSHAPEPEPRFPAHRSFLRRQHPRQGHRPPLVEAHGHGYHEALTSTGARLWAEALSIMPPNGGSLK